MFRDMYRLDFPIYLQISNILRIILLVCLFTVESEEKQWGKHYSQSIWVLPYSCMLKSVKNHWLLRLAHALQPRTAPQSSQATATTGQECMGLTQTCSSTSSAQKFSRKIVFSGRMEKQSSTTPLLAISIFFPSTYMLSFGVLLQKILSSVPFLVRGWHGHTSLQKQMYRPRRHLS